MNRIDSSKAFKQKTVPSGTVLFIQGQQVRSIMMLHSGMAELLVQEGGPREEESPAQIIASSIRVGLIRGESLCGILGLQEGLSLGHSIVTVSECTISNTPVEPDLIVQTLQKHMRLNIQVLQALVQRLESSMFLFTNYKYLWHKLALIQDSIALGGGEPGDEEPRTLPDRYDCHIDEYSRYLNFQLEQLGRSRPSPWDANLFLGRMQDGLDLYLQYDNLRPETIFDHSQYLFIKRLLRKDERIIAALFMKDEPANQYVLQFLSKALETMMGYNKAIVGHIEKLTRVLYADEGWVRILLDREDRESFACRNFLHFLWKFSWSCHRDGIKLLHRDFTEMFPIYRSLLDYREQPDPEAFARQLEGLTGEAPGQPGAGGAGGSDRSPESADPARRAKYKGLLDKILSFAEMGDGFDSDFRDAHQQLVSLEDPQDASPEAKSLRQHYSQMYWELYGVCLLKIMDSDLKSFVPGIMLHFGLIDETLVEPEQLDIIDQAYSELLFTQEPVPAMTLPYFLEKIFTGEIQPSMNEMGEGFRELLKRQEKMSPREREASPHLYSDTPEDRVRYELRQVSSQISRMLFGSKSRALPIIDSRVLQGGSLDRLLIGPQNCAELVQSFRDRDFSLFYRETVCKHRFGTDLVRKEVLPNLVLFPVFGTRMMMWQELDGSKRDSAARLMMPMYFAGETREAIGNMLGQFRWELARAMAGANWMDPVEGGLSGAYYDYIAFYKRNPNLNPAHKEKLAEFIRKTRSDRDRFVSDYLTWVEYEYEGKMRFNPVVRDIFYRLVPFNREMRSELEKRPLFAELEGKYQNRIRKESLRLESRFKKFEKAGEKLPRDMEDYMSFLQL